MSGAAVIRGSPSVSHKITCRTHSPRLRALRGEMEVGGNYAAATCARPEAITLQLCARRGRRGRGSPAHATQCDGVHPRATSRAGLYRQATGRTPSAKKKL